MRLLVVEDEDRLAKALSGFNNERVLLSIILTMVKKPSNML